METARSHQRTILVIDDDEDMLIMMQQMLLREGYNPIFSPNGLAAMEIITQRQPDLVLMDIHMEGIDGGELCKEVKANPRTAHIPIVMFSANENIKEVMQDCGANGYLTKPFAPGKLTVLFRNLLEPVTKPLYNDQALHEILHGLEDLDREPVLMGGQQVKASQCYRFDKVTGHILYNTNCPDSLRNKIDMLLSTHLTRAGK